MCLKEFIFFDLNVKPEHNETFKIGMCTAITQISLRIHKV